MVNMRYDPDKHHRHSIRLKAYDYGQTGAYFVTIVTQARACLLGQVVDAKMQLNVPGQMVETVWTELLVFYPGVDIDGFAVMPNHIHGIIVLVGAAPRGRPGLGSDALPDLGWVGAPPCGCPGPAPTALSLPDVVHRFKTMTTKRYVDGVNHSGWPPFYVRLWQHNYFEHIIRNETSLARIREYIANNPLQWELDPENPSKSGTSTPL